MRKSFRYAILPSEAGILVGEDREREVLGSVESKQEPK